MLRGITHRQFEEWRAFMDLEPFDEERADARSAQVVQAVYNVNRKRGTPPVKLEDCLLTFGAQAKGLQPRTAAQAKAQAAQVRSVMDSMVAAQNQPRRKRG